jgi:RNA polymerase sigma factor (sigma-70 family)
MTTTQPEPAMLAREIEIGADLTPLTLAEDLELGRRARAGDRSAVDTLIRHNLKWAAKVALRSARHRRFTPAQAYSAALTGMLYAAGKYDPDRGIKFGTYATYWIRQAIDRAKKGEGGPIHVPEYMVDAIARKRKGLPLANDSQTEREAQGVAANLPDALAARSSSTYGLVDLTRRERSTLDDVIDRDERARLADALTKLDDRLRGIIEARFLSPNDETLGQIGKRLGLTGERVRQLEVMAIAQLKAAINPNADAA